MTGFLARCVASVQAQQHVAVEHILIADASEPFYALAASLAAQHDHTSAHLLPDTELLEFICNENNRDVPHLPGQ